MTSIDLNSMTAMNLDGLSTKIAVNDLNVWYGKFHALKHITLAIPEGRVTAFIGPSGCGKSALINMLAGYETPDAGSILIEPGSSNCQKLRLVRPGQEDICSEYSESPWFYEVAEIAMILALKDYDACYAALKKTRQVVTVLEAAREDAQLGF